MVCCTDCWFQLKGPYSCIDYDKKSGAAFVSFLGILCPNPHSCDWHPILFTSQGVNVSTLRVEILDLLTNGGSLLLCSGVRECYSSLIALMVIHW